MLSNVGRSNRSLSKEDGYSQNEEEEEEKKY